MAELTKDNLWDGYWSWSWWWATSTSSPAPSFLWQRITCRMIIGGLGGGPRQHHHQHHHCHDKGQRAEWISVAFTVLVVDKSKARWKRHLCQDSQLNREHLCQGAFVSRPNKRDNFVRPTKKESWTLKRTDAFPRLVFLHLFCPQTLQRRDVKDRKIFQDSLQSRSQNLWI